jgi:hypothetical protein
MVIYHKPCGYQEGGFIDKTSLLGRTVAHQRQLPPGRRDPAAQPSTAVHVLGAWRTQWTQTNDA